MFQPTILLDETEKYVEHGSDLHALLNEGHCKGASVMRVLGDKQELREFSIYGAAAFARNGALPDDLDQRSVVIELQRRRANEPLQELREDHCEPLIRLARMCARWAQDHAADLRGHDPDMGDLIDRGGDNWRPLIALANVIGDEWSERIRSAARRLAPREPSSYGVVLLGDIKATFTDRFFSADLAEALAKIEGRPWAEWGRAGKPISANQIAKLLKEYKICPDQLRIGDRTAKGYHLHQFTEAFQRYLGPHPPTEPKQRNKPTATGTSELFRNETEKTDVSVQKCEKPASKGHCFDVSVQKGGAPVCEHHNGGARAFESDVEDAQEELRERGLTVCEQCGRAGRDVLPFAYAGHVGTLHPRCRHSWLLAHGVDLGIPAALRRSQ